MLRFEDLIPAHTQAQPEMQIWFLTITEAVGELYAQVAHQSQILVGQLNQLRLGARIVWKPPLNSEHQHLPSLDHDYTGLVGSIIWPTSSAVTPSLADGFLESARPCLVVDFTDQPQMPGDVLPPDVIELSRPAGHAAHFANMLARLGVSQQLIAGAPTDPQMQSAVRSWVTQCIDREDLRNSG